MKSATAARRALPRKFERLSALHPLRPIGDRSGLREARRVADRLAVLDRRTRDQEDYLETLSTLIEKYEAERAAIDTSGLTPAEMLRYLMRGREMSASDLGRLLGERSLGPAILRGDRELSKAHVRALCAHFCVSPAVFIRP